MTEEANRKRKNRFSVYLYRDRSAIERTLCRLAMAGFTTNFLPAIFIAATAGR